MPIVEISTLLANIALALTFIIGLVFGIVQVKAVERDRRERLTLETLRNFQTREFAELIQLINSSEFPKTEEELDQLSPRDMSMYIQFAQQMESLGILVAENLIDLQLVDKTLGSFVVTSWKKYKVVLASIREKRDPYLSEYFQWLAERVEENSKKSPRKPFYFKEGGQ